MPDQNAQSPGLFHECIYTITMSCRNRKEERTPEETISCLSCNMHKDKSRSQDPLECEHVYAGAAWYLFHDIIGPEVLEQKGNIFHVQPTMHSTLSVYDTRPLITREV